MTDRYNQGFQDGYSDGYDAGLRADPDSLAPYIAMVCIGAMLGLFFGWWLWS